MVVKKIIIVLYTIVQKKYIELSFGIHIELHFVVYFELLTY